MSLTIKTSRKSRTITQHQSAKKDEGVTCGANRSTQAPRYRVHSRFDRDGGQTATPLRLPEVVIPTKLQDIGIRAFCGCEQLWRFTPLDWREIDKTIQAEHNAFLLCDNFERASWVELLPSEGPDSDAFDEELHTEFP